MEKIKIKIGQNVVVPFVRSNHLDSENGIGWTCQNAIVEVSKINDLTFCFEFNGENHFELISEATPSRSSQSNLFGEALHNFSSLAGF